MEKSKGHSVQLCLSDEDFSKLYELRDLIAPELYCPRRAKQYGKREKVRTLASTMRYALRVTHHIEANRHKED